MPLRTQTVLCLDVSFRHCGWAVIRDGVPVACGCIHTADNKKLPASRTDMDLMDVRYLAGRLQGIASVHRVTMVIGEMPTGGSKSARANSCMGLAKACAAVALQSYPCHWVPPRKTKADAAALVAERWPDWVPPKLKKDSEHVIDALAAWIQFEEDQHNV